MKKSNLYTGIFYLLAGTACLMTALLSDSRLNSLLFGFAGGGIAPGITLLFRYFYWSSPKHRAACTERMEAEQIELHDERKEKLRDRSGRCAYLIVLCVTGISCMIFSILGHLEIILNYRLIVIYLGIFFIFQYLAGVLIFRHLNNKF